MTAFLFRKEIPTVFLFRIRQTRRSKKGCPLYVSSKTVYMTVRFPEFPSSPTTIYADNRNSL